MKSTRNRFHAITASLMILILTSAFFKGEAERSYGLFEIPSTGLVLAVSLFFIGLILFFICRRVIEQRTAFYSSKNHELEILLNERNAQLEATTKELEAFAYSISHDLRSPLRTMMAYTEILLTEHSENMSEDGRLYQQRVRANAERLDQFIDGILTYSGLSSQMLNRELVNMEDLTLQVIAELERKIGDRQVNFSVGKLPPAAADAQMIRVVITNLIDNAFKFSDLQETAEIEVGFKQKAGRVVYFVQDNGIGLDMKFSETIFKTFQRLHGVDQYGGSGIGLALVKRIIARHGGRVWVEAEEGKGAVFYFTLGDHKFV